MVDSGDTGVLSAEALVDPAVVAALALCIFRGASPPDEPAPTPTAAVDLPPAWGCHAFRSERWIRDYTEIRLLSNSKDATAPKRRRSPVTPLEHRGGSGAPESCSEEILGKRSDTGGVPGGPAVPETKVVVSGERDLSDFRISGSKPIRRSSVKKKLTLPELEAMHQSLLEHRRFLLEELEAKWRFKEALVAKNREFKKLKETGDGQRAMWILGLSEHGDGQRAMWILGLSEHGARKSEIASASQSSEWDWSLGKDRTLHRCLKKSIPKEFDCLI